MKNEKDEQESYLFAPKMKKFFEKRRKSEALMWIPVETSLLFSDEFQNITPVNRCIFVSFMLLCGVRGDFEIPFKINYLSNTLGINKRSISKGIEELISANLLHKRERKKEEKEKKSTDSTEREITPDGGAVCVDSKNYFQDDSEKINSSEDENKSGLLKIVPQVQNLNDKNKHSQFSIEECLKYVEICKTNGEEIKSTKALANHLFKTGESDAFILQTLYPKQQEEIDRETFGEPRQFSDEPCTVCFGAKMADPDGKGFRACEHCRNERGKPTGWEPLKIDN